MSRLTHYTALHDSDRSRGQVDVYLLITPLAAPVTEFCSRYYLHITSAFNEGHLTEVTIDIDVWLVISSGAAEVWKDSGDEKSQCWGCYEY